METMDQSTTIETVTLNNGIEMLLLVFRVLQVTDLKACELSAYDAIQAGSE